MKLLCKKCKNIPNIKINNLSYCSDCFLTGFQQKIVKSIRNIRPQSKLMFLCKNKTEEQVSENIVQMISAQKGITCFYDIQQLDNKKCNYCSKTCYNENIIEESKSMVSANDSIITYPGDEKISSDVSNCCNFQANGSYTCLNRISSWITKYSIHGSFDFVFYFETLNSIAINSLELICQGNGTGAAKNCNFSEHVSGDVIICNLFHEVKDKEIAYYCYLKNIPRKVYSEPSKVRIILRDFINEADDRNGLVLYNIVNTLKKMDNRNMMQLV